MVDTAASRDDVRELAETERRAELANVARTPLTSEYDAMYATTPPWEIGRPQPSLLRIAEAGGLAGAVLDVGCGTGEHALMAARLGHEAHGLDVSPAAIDIARGKATERGLAATFEVGNVLDLPRLGRQFDTVLDSALFHVLSDEDRLTYQAAARAALRPGGHYYLLCFSEREAGSWGPRRVSREDIRANFAEGWEVVTVAPAIIELSSVQDSARCWLATLRRV